MRLRFVDGRPEQRVSDLARLDDDRLLLRGLLPGEWTLSLRLSEDTAGDVRVKIAEDTYRTEKQSYYGTQRDLTVTPRGDSTLHL